MRVQGENWWRLWCVVVLVSAGVLATVGVASATTPVTSQELEAVQTASGLSSIRAQADLAVQHQASRVDLPAQLDEELGSDYASVWFDGKRGEFVVPLATAEDPENSTEEGRGVVREVFQSAALAGDVRTEVVAFSQ